MIERKEMKEAKKRKSYEKPAVIFEKELEALAADCGSGDNNVYMGGNNCKGVGVCIVAFS
jgi:hypothetical protein